MEKRSMALLTLFQEGMELESNNLTQKQLGNRNKYIGMSDIGSYSICPRKAILSRIEPKTNDLSKTITLNRGHWIEDGVAKAFNAKGISAIRQLEISVTYKGVDIKAHLDFCMITTNPKPIVRILEVKSMNTLPDSLYAGYELQLYGQICLLNSYYNRHVFTVRNEHGEVLIESATFPELVNKLYRTEFPDDPRKANIEGWLLAVSSDNAKTFGPYKANSSMKSMVLDYAVEMQNNIKSLVNKADLPIAQGLNTLCPYCDYAHDCPKFHGVHIEGLDSILEELDEWKSKKAELEANIKQRETEMKELYARVAENGEWLIGGNKRIKVSTVTGRKSLDMEGIFNEIGTLGIDTEELKSRHEKYGFPFKRLNIATI